MGKGIVVVGVAALGVFALVVAMLWVFQRHLYYQPDTGAVPSAATAIAHAQEVSLRTDDGLDLGAWWIPATHGADLETVETGMTVLVANGNGGHRAHRAELARALSDAGFSVLLFDYRGYGDNPGSPTEDGLALDVRAAHRHLTEDRGIASERLLYFGESLGTGVVSELAREHPPAGLVLRSPFTALADVADDLYPWLPVRHMLWDQYPVTDNLRESDVPTTVIYGSADGLIGPEQSQRVADVAGATDVVEVAGADHNDPALAAGPEVVDAVVRLAARSGSR